MVQISINQPCLLLVEGNDDQNFFNVVLKHCDRDDIQVLEFGGVYKLRGYLSALVTTPGWQQVVSLGIVRDAENDAESAKASVRGAVANAGLQMDGSAPRVSLLVLPDGERPGMLETLLCDSFADSPINDCINEFLACSTERAGANVKRMAKARAHAYLATREDPHVSVGVAAQKDYWDLGHPAFEQLRDFIAGL